MQAALQELTAAAVKAAVADVRAAFAARREWDVELAVRDETEEADFDERAVRSVLASCRLRDALQLAMGGCVAVRQEMRRTLLEDANAAAVGAAGDAG